jgi:uncharacterized protein (TIGR00725 family)
MIILSVLEITSQQAKTLIKQLESYDQNVPIQIDIADGQLVDGKTFTDIHALDDFDTSAKLELHLMVENPMDYLDHRIYKITRICSQIEALNDNALFINRAKELGYSVGLSVGPDTNYDQLEHYISQIDYVQFMDILPGAQGRPQIHEVVYKIAEFHKKFPHIPLQVDGSVKQKTIPELLKVGVSNFVVGSEILKATKPKEKYIELKNMTGATEITSLKDAKRIQKVAILGGAAWRSDDQTYIDAYEVSKVLAEAGYEIVNGGGPGIMRASTKGAHAGGGRVLAITYHPNKPKRHYEGVDSENDFDDEIITLDYFDRTKVMLQTTQLHIVFKGSLGTLSELGMTWISSWIHEPDNKPIILYGEFWNDYLHVIDKHALVFDAEKSIVKVCTTPAEVLEYVRSFD